MKRIAVLASGSGSNLQALIDHFNERPNASAHVAWVGSNRADAGALARAKAAGIEHAFIKAHDDADSMLRMLHDARVDLLVLAGYLKLIPLDVVRAFHGRMINVHPALLPAFGGHGMYGQRVHAAVIAAGATVTGVTVHFVDEQFDRGAIIAQWPVPVFDGDTPDSLATRVLRIEHVIYPRAVDAVARGLVTLSADGKRVTTARASNDLLLHDAHFRLVDDSPPQLDSALFALHLPPPTS